MAEQLSARITDETTPDQLLELEAEVGRSEYFADLDALLGEVLVAAFRREPVFTIQRRDVPDVAHRVRLEHLTPSAAVTLRERFDLSLLEANGAWFVPEELRLRQGFVNLPRLAAVQPRFCVNLAREEWAAVALRDDPAAAASWSLIIPMFNELLAPVDLRTATTKPKAERAARAAWAEVHQTYEDLGLDGGDALAAMSYGAGWVMRPLDEMVAVRSQLLDRLSLQVSAAAASRWRARTTLRLVRAFQKKAKRGTPLAKQVLTKQLQPAFAGLFRGSWIEFLAYLGETPNDAEQITTALPEPRLYVGVDRRAAEVAADRGLEVDQVQRILASYLGTAPDSESPVHERVQCMKEWWPHFDQAHAAQTSGMAPLWGLVDDGTFVVHEGTRTPAQRLYRRFIPGELCADIERLWDGITAARWPDKIVSEFHPHRQMAEAFGPALKLWNGVALSTWFICEGPTSRTDLAGLEEYHRREMHELAEMGFAPDSSMFAELREAESRLGPVQELSDEIREHGMVIQTFGGYRRDGFEILRDIVTRHRHTWAATKLDSYLEARWELELREIAHEYSRRVAARSGKPPTLKQFASFGAPAANHWFNGDLARLYAALGERSETTTERIDLLAGDPVEFGRAVYATLGGGPPIDEDRTDLDWDERNRQYGLERFARAAFKYLQRYEVLGRPPTFDEFDGGQLEWELLGGADVGWKRFQEAIEAARSQPFGARTEAAAGASQARPTSQATEVVTPPAAWFPDPMRRFEYRYWDGSAWTEHVATGGQQGVDPVT